MYHKYMPSDENNDGNNGREEINSLVIPEVEGFRGSPLRDRFESALQNMLLATSTIQQIDELDEAVMSLRYKEVLKPQYDEQNPVTQQSEANRFMLSYAIQEDIDIPAELCTQATYSEITTQELLLRTFNEEQLQMLQGVLVFNILEGHGQKGLDEDNTLAVGGLTYTQYKLDAEGGPLGLYVRATAAPKGVKEGLEDKLFRNVAGTIHAIPYGVPKKIPGREKEAILMMADDFLRLWEHMYKIEDDNLKPPRFAMGTTNRTMALAAEKVTKAQVGYFEFQGPHELARVLKNTVGVASAEKKGADTEPPMTVFLSENDLEDSKEHVTSVRQSVYNRLKQEDESMEQTLGRVRAEAIEILSGKFDFVSLYKESTTPQEQETTTTII